MAIQKKGIPKIDPKVNHHIEKCLLHNGEIYVPIAEIIKMCKKFSSFYLKQFAPFLEAAEKEAKARLLIPKPAEIFLTPESKTSIFTKIKSLFNESR